MNAPKRPATPQAQFHIEAPAPAPALTQEEKDAQRGCAIVAVVLGGGSILALAWFFADKIYAMWKWAGSF